MHQPRYSSLAVIILAFALVAPLTACTDDENEEGESASALYEPCADDSTCADGLSCICGVCTRLCTDDDTVCDSAGTCVSSGYVLCGEDIARDAFVCQQTCENDASCEDPRADFICNTIPDNQICKRTDPDAPLRDPDAGTDMDADSGQNLPDTAGLTCDNISAEFDAFVDANKSCTEDSDCTVVGGTGSCNCTPVLGAGSGEAINREAAGAAGVYFSFFDSNDCGGSFGTCDAAPASNLRCESGVCRADTESCLSFEDAGSQADSGSSDGG